MYVPKTSLKKKDAAIGVSTYLDLLNTKGEYQGAIWGRISITAVNENGKIKLYGWDEEANKEIKVSKYATCKAGTGNYKSFYIISLKNIPLYSKIFRDVDGASTTEKVKSSTKYAYNIGFNLSGDKNKSSGKLYIDNVKVVSGSKKITSIDFSKKIDYWGWVKGKDITKKKMAIVKF